MMHWPIVYVRCSAFLLIVGGTLFAGQDSTFASRFNNAVDLFNEHDDTGEALAEAKSSFLSISQSHPDHATSRAYLGLIALEERDTLSADSLFDVALRLDSSCAEAYVGREQLLRMKGQWEAGEQELHRAIERAPTNIWARAELVNVLLRGAERPMTKERNEAALPHLETIIRLDSNNRDAHYDLAQASEYLQRWNDAVIHYREVLRIGVLPEDMDVWLYTVHQDIARCLEAAGDNKGAADELTLYLHSLEEFGADKETTRQLESKIRELHRTK